MSKRQEIPAGEDTTWVITEREDGKVSVSMRDDESGEYVPTVRIVFNWDAALLYIAGPAYSPSFVTI